VDLNPLFRPKSIAVIGVSLSNDRHPANVIYDKINLRYPVTVFAVNPRGGQLHRNQVYKDITEIPEPVDLAVIAARSKYVPAILKGCIEKKVGGATIISGGFAEVGGRIFRMRSFRWLTRRNFPLSDPIVWEFMRPIDSILSFCRVSG
jgi:acyl-CoA synthetase (NDP forming)